VCEKKQSVLWRRRNAINRRKKQTRGVKGIKIQRKKAVSASFKYHHEACSSPCGNDKKSKALFRLRIAVDLEEKEGDDLSSGVPPGWAKRRIKGERRSYVREHTNLCASCKRMERSLLIKNPKKNIMRERAWGSNQG